MIEKVCNREGILKSLRDINETINDIKIKNKR